MPLSAREKKRRSRARKPSAYHDREREASRKRMAIKRARIKAEKRASQFKSILNEVDKKAFEARADKEKQRLICDRFNCNGIRFDPKVMKDDKILSAFLTKSELHEIELQVAEFEISMGEKTIAKLNSMLGVYFASGLEKDNEKNTAKSHKIDLSEQNLNNQINRSSEREMATSVIYGNEVPEILGMEQEDTTKPAYSGKNGIGVLSEGKEDSISWEDEVLAAEAMATMQHKQREERKNHPRAKHECESSAMPTEGFGVKK